MTKLRSLCARLLAFVFAFACAFVAAADAAPPDDVLPEGPRGVVVSVIDGDTVRLKDGSADIRLIGLQAPKLPLDRKGVAAWPLAAEARETLAALVQDKSVRVRLGTAARDRHGRILGHLVRDDDLWIQAEMLRRGFARVYTFPDNRALAVDMLALEAQARAARAGIWAHPFYAVRDAQAPDLINDRQTFQIVAGTIIDVAKTKDRIYLNFGADFRTDFTVAVEKRDWKLFDNAKFDLLGLQGKRIEVRGWLVSRNGPMIEVTHPEQIALD